MGEGSDRLDKLRSIPLFAGVSDASLDRMLAAASECSVDPGHVLMERGHPGAGLFVIEEGTVTIDLGSREVELGPGEFFGELALLTESAHTGRAKAKTEVTAFAISRTDFTELLENEPKMALAMLSALAERLAKAP
jgi:CRP-like cAMP-binding protein